MLWYYVNSCLMSDHFKWSTNGLLMRKFNSWESSNSKPNHTGSCICTCIRNFICHGMTWPNLGLYQGIHEFIWTTGSQNWYRIVRQCSRVRFCTFTWKKKKKNYIFQCISLILAFYNVQYREDRKLELWRSELKKWLTASAVTLSNVWYHI